MLILLWITCYFYPRPLRGGRPYLWQIPQQRKRFLSTPSARRATIMLAGLGSALLDFYPRPLRGGRPASVGFAVAVSHFYPRPLRGGRPYDDDNVPTQDTISIHALCEEGDCRQFCCIIWHSHFYPRPLRGGRHTAAVSVTPYNDFYPRPLRGGRPITCARACAFN